jgi:hypothetical protein
MTFPASMSIKKRAFQEGGGVREIALEMEVLPPDEFSAAFNVRPMTERSLSE